MRCLQKDGHRGVEAGVENSWVVVGYGTHHRMEDVEMIGEGEEVQIYERGSAGVKEGGSGEGGGRVREVDSYPVAEYGRNPGCSRAEADHLLYDLNRMCHLDVHSLENPGDSRWVGGGRARGDSNGLRCLLRGRGTSLESSSGYCHHHGVFGRDLHLCPIGLVHDLESCLRHILAGVG